MKIFTYAFNNPLYLTYQIKCFKKFITEPFEFYCIDNSYRTKYSTFKEICAKENVFYKKSLGQNHYMPSISHYAVLQWSYENLIKDTQEIIIMIDHDIFPIDYISINDLLGDAKIAGVAQNRGEIHYLHPSFVILNTKDLPNKHTINFGGTNVDGISTDTGGKFHFYFKSNPTVKKKYLFSRYLGLNDKIVGNNLPQQMKGMDEFISSQSFELIEEKFLHTRNGSNWEKLDKNILQKRDEFIVGILKEKLK